MPEFSTMTRHDIETLVVQRAWDDEAFRAELLANPSATFEKYSGVPASQLPRIVVHEEQAGDWAFVLPARPAAGAALSDAEMQAVAGGAITSAEQTKRYAAVSLNPIGGKNPGTW